MKESPSAPKPSVPRPEPARHGEAARASPITAALRVKDMAMDIAGDLAEGYRKSTRYAKMRGAVIGSWALLSAVCIWLACPSGEGNSLGAKAVVSEGILGSKVVLVWNASEKTWTDVTLTLDDKWEWKTSTLRPGEKQSLRPDEFARDGSAAPQDLMPRTLAVECHQGSATVALGAGAP